MNKRDTPTHLTAEQFLLLAAAAPELNSAQTDRLRAAAQAPIDWGRLLDLAAWHGLTPMLSHNLQQHAVDRVPSNVLAGLAASDLANSAWSNRAGGALVELVDRLQKAGVESLPFKGPVQSLQLYGSIALREFADVDLLVDPAHARDAHEVMLAAGYAPEVAIAAHQLSLYMRSECDRVYVHPSSKIQVEIHWALTPRYFGVEVPAATFFQRAERVSLDGREIRTVAREDLLLILCVNGAKELWEKLEWLTALTVLLNGRTLDWTRIDRITANSGTRRMVRIGVGLAADVMGAAVTDQLRLELERDRTAKRLIAEAKAWMFATHFQGLQRGQITKFRLRARERRRDRIRYRWLRMITPTHPDLAFVRLTPRLQFLYYALRPVRLTAEKLRRQEPPRSIG